MTDVDFAPPVSTGCDMCVSYPTRQRWPVLLSQVLLEVWDWDKFDSNDLACHYRYPLNGNSEMSTLRCNPLLAPLPDTLPDPCWVTLEHFSEPDHARTPQWGSLLVSFQLIEKRSPTDFVPRIPASIEPEADQR